LAGARARGGKQKSAPYASLDEREKIEIASGLAAGDVLPFALGAAAAMRATAGSQALVMAFVEAIAPEGEAQLRFAAEKRLPLVVVSVTRGEKRMKRRPRAGKRVQSGITHFEVDANDAIAIYRVVQESNLRARIRQAATWIECRTDLEYTAEQERGFLHVNRGDEMAHDPLALLEHHLRVKGL
jgi:TPP-dependent pyruvate/acetoin dehydrogenase alpha subunit